MRKQEMDYIFTQMLDSHQDISDLNITVGKPLQVESSGVLLPVETHPPFSDLTPFQTEMFALNLIDNDRRLINQLINRGSCDLSYEVPGKARFRVSIFSQRGSYSVVMRKMASRIPTIAELELPEAFYRIASEQNGIVLVTGATGSGKTTSLAAVLNEINNNKAVHIITLEDPVEFSPPHRMATFNQRELGKDFESFPVGLRAALRQAPKVILVGELRDRETMETGIAAAETGHLVLATLHTVDAGSTTINRILGMFSAEEENLIRLRLADTIRWVVCQRLLPKIGGGRVAAFEVMSTSLRVKDAIVNGEVEGRTFYDIMETGKAFSMVTFDEYIIDLYAKGLVTEETAKAYASNRSIVGRGIDSLKSAKGQKTTSLGKLQMDNRYGKQKVW